MAINKVIYGDNVLVDLTPTTAEAEDVIEGKTFVNRNGVLTTGTSTGGSTGGSSDYEELDNKPSINNVELIGNKTTSDLGIEIPTVPTNLSSFTDDLGSNPTHTHNQYLTSHQDISGKLDTSKVKTTTSTTSGDVYDVTYINSILNDAYALINAKANASDIVVYTAGTGVSIQNGVISLSLTSAESEEF